MRDTRPTRAFSAKASEKKKKPSAPEPPREQKRCYFEGGIARFLHGVETESLSDAIDGMFEHEKSRADGLVNLTGMATLSLLRFYYYRRRRRRRRETGVFFFVFFFVFFRWYA